MKLTYPQQCAVDSNAPNILCLAGAGSGKTRTLIARIQRLVEQGADPSRIVAITFTNAAAAEMSRRLEHVPTAEELASPPDPAYKRVIRLGYCGTLHGYCLRFIKQSGKAIGYGDAISVVTEEQAGDVLDRCVAECKYTGTIGDLNKVVLRGAFDLAANAKRRRLDKAEVVAASYFRQMREGQMLDFDGILHAAIQLLAVHDCQPSPKPTHLFVDEFQDSSDRDAEIYELLAVPNRFTVGDSDQAIYSFRGGNVSNIVRMAATGDCELHKLEQNFRCDEAIAHAAQLLIEHNSYRPAKRTVSATGNRGTITATAERSCDTEKVTLADAVRRYVADGVPAEEVAVLCRTNHLVSEFVNVLRSNGLPVAKPLRQATPADWIAVTSFVSLLVNPDNDTLALFYVEQRKGEAKRQSVQMKALRAMSSVNDAELNLPHGLKPSEVAPVLAREGFSRESVDRVETTAAKLPSCAGLDELCVALNSRDEDERSSGVTVATMHAMKGREASVVFLPAFEQGTIPQRRADTDLEEERRLAYVALTRAKVACHVSYAAERVPQYGNGKPVACKASQFVAEAGL